MKKFIEEVLLTNGKIKTRRIEKDAKWLLANYPKEYTFIKNETLFTECWSTKIYCIYNNIKEIPKCQHCQKEVALYTYKHGFRKYCSNECKKHYTHQHTEESYKKQLETKQKNHSYILKNFQPNDNNILSIESLLIFFDSIHFNSISYAHLIKYSIEFNSLFYHTKFIKFDNTSFTTLEIPQRYFLLKHNLLDIPICRICNKNELNFINSEIGYSKTCGVDCGIKHTAVQRILTTENKIIKKITKFKLVSKYSGRKNQTEIVCIYCNKIIKKQFKNGSNFDFVCSNCFPYKNKSKIEYKIKEFLEQKNIKVVHSFKINKTEIDLYLPEYNIGIEFDGIYWHAESKGKTKNYHLNKTLLCKENNITLLHFFENETTFKLPIVKSIIMSKLKIYENKFFARKCETKEISFIDTSNFLIKNHLQGSYNTKYNYGLYYDNELVSVMTFNRRKISSKTNFELIRFANKINTTVIGGASKLFNYFLKHNSDITEIITYADKRLSDGNLYNILNFKHTHNSSPNYWYFKKNKPLVIYSRIQFQKHKLKNKLKLFDYDLTEYENMKNNNYDRIWDCGNMVFLYKREN